MTGQERPRMPLNLEIGKLPPQAIEVEEVVLGALMLEKDAIYQVATILRPEIFYNDGHQKVYQAIEDLFKKGKVIDILTVTNQLRKNKSLEDVGGPAYLTGLTCRVTSSAHIEPHSYIIKQKFISRSVIRIATRIQEKAYDESIDISDTLDYLQSEMYKIVNDITGTEASSIGEIGKKVIEEFEMIAKLNLDMSGIPSGFTKVDRITSGWQNSDFIVLGARPSMGKTALALKFASYPCKHGKKVLVFSLEMTKKQLVHRLLSSETGIENGYFRIAKFDDVDWQKIEVAQAEFEKMGLFIDDTAGLSIIDFRAKAMLAKQKHGIDMIIIDYLQLMTSPGEREREQVISNISRNIKAVAKELDIPIMALSQLNRVLEHRADKKPILSDIRESGAIEQDADIVGFIHRPEYYGITELADGTRTDRLIELIFAKHRNGPIADFKLWRSKSWSDIYERLDLTDDVDGEDVFGSDTPKRKKSLAIDKKSAAANDDTHKPEGTITIESTPFDDGSSPF